MGHGPPYRAVRELAALTATHWRTIRARLLTAGVAEPMRLPHMHMLLDVTEQLMRQGMTAEREKRFDADLYRPEAGVLAAGGARPRGFSPAEVSGALDAFAAAAGEHDDDD